MKTSTTKMVNTATSANFLVLLCDISRTHFFCSIKKSLKHDVHEESVLEHSLQLESHGRQELFFKKNPARHSTEQIR
uniref:Uncharacterized protein n=1 Tax=Arion vulgaris TaxID=1028688 RepID=A0A0B7BCK2_9EUPU